MTRSKLTIHISARNGDLPAVAAELAKGVPVDLRDPATDYTPLMTALGGSGTSMELVSFLIAHGADPNAVATDPISAQLRKSVQIPEVTSQMEATLRQCGISSEQIAILRHHSPNDHLPLQQNVLSLAIRLGDRSIVEALLDAGADIHYLRNGGYDPVIDATIGANHRKQQDLIELLRLLIGRGANVNGASDYAESALSITSHRGLFETVRFLLDAGADPSPLEWTPLMQTVALGSVSDVRTALAGMPDLTSRDRWDRTPWLLSLQVGDIDKARLLLAAGADRSDIGRCGCPPLFHALESGHPDMLRWLLDQGFHPDQADDSGTTALIQASSHGDAQTVRLLLEAGASINASTTWQDTPIKVAENLDVVNVLVQHGADLAQISEQARAAMTRLPNDRKLDVSPSDYLDARHRIFGASNPQLMTFPFWQAMVRSGCCAYDARSAFSDEDYSQPIWTFQRFGRSLTPLPDGRIIEIAGEHEDHYDPDFCIYNDVFVHHGDGTFDIYGYPRESFPPTDFHTATLVGQYIYIIGSLGYVEDRKPGHTPVFRLNTQTLQIDPYPTTGQAPGWIFKHRARLVGDTEIEVTGGDIQASPNRSDPHIPNPHAYVLHLPTAAWHIHPAK